MKRAPDDLLLTLLFPSFSLPFSLPRMYMCATYVSRSHAIFTIFIREGST